MSMVVVLNADEQVHDRVSVQHAIKMLARQVAVVHEAVEGESFGPYPLPKVLRLVKYVVLRWRSRVPRWNKNRLLRRDKHTCGYCGTKASTVDHIVPRSQGGKSTWLNTVASCLPCNNHKDNRTPSEARMRLRIEPFEPTWWVIGGD